MKKIMGVIALSILLLATNGLTNQRNQEISLSMGAITYQDIGEAFTDVLVSTFFAGATKTKYTSQTSAINVSYKRFVRNFDFSFTLNYQEFKKKTYATITEPDSLIGKSTEDWYALICQGNYNYLRNDWFRLYSGLGVGYSYFYEKGFGDTYDDNNFAFQVNLIGMRIGKKFGGFLEVGAGFKGIVNLGLSYRF